MTLVANNRHAVMLLPAALLLVGCHKPAAPLNLNATAPAYEQSNIAGYHDNEAAFFRLKARELHQRMLVYWQLFGPDSDWVQGARILARFYEEAAQEQERLSGADPPVSPVPTPLATP